MHKYICSISREFQPTLSYSYLIDTEISLRNKNHFSKWKPFQLLCLIDESIFLGQCSAKEASVTLTNDT